MTCRFFGSLSETRSPALDLRLDSRLAVSRFEGGCVAHDATVNASELGGEHCVSFGEPIFRDPDIAALAARDGQAAAWLTLFRKLGRLAPTRVAGRFAVAAMFPAGRRVLVATDRFATCSVSYSVADGRVAFSDRADAVRPGSRELTAQALFDYLYFHMIPTPATVFAGVSRLPPGHLLEWLDGKSECVPYWVPEFDERARPDLHSSRRKFMQLVEGAVAREARGSVGAYLSGGTDSSTVSGMLTKVRGEPAKTYSIGFDATGYDEMAYARIAARHFGTDHHEYYVTPDDLVLGIPKVAEYYDQPFGNSSAVPAWFCAQRAKQDGVEKLLAGDGGDELFGGNTRYATQRVFSWYESVPQVLRRYVLEPAFAAPGIRSLPMLKKGTSYIAQARIPLPARLQTYHLLTRLGVDTLLEPAFLAAIDVQGPLAAQNATWRSVHADSAINRMLAFDWKYTLADSDLPKVVGTAQLAGVDVGFPFLDDDLLDFSLGLPPEWKLKRLTLRWFFKDALKEFLPPEIISKKKHGFGLPFGVWACRHEGLMRQVRDALRGLAARGIVQPRFLEDLLEKQLPAHPGYYGGMVWVLMMLELWLRTHAPDWVFES
jgi:asparagine synthase (glutamine-hydrolysing)